MKNDMNLIMENWRANTKEIVKDKKIETVGELRAFVKSQRLKAAGKEIGKKAADVILSVIPGVNVAYKVFGGAKSIKSAFKKFHGLDDDVKTNTGMDKLNVDDQYSKIVDDGIEEGFLDDFLARISKLPDDAPIPDANEQLQDYLQYKFDNRTVDVANEE